MNKEIQTLVALQLLSQNDSITTHEYRDNKIVEIKAISILDSLKMAIEQGLDIMLPLEEENIRPNRSYSMGTNGKITFVEQMMENHSSEKGLINYLYEKITKEDLKKVHPKFMSNIYTIFNDNSVSMKGMFELGFDFKQGSFDEDSKASSGDMDFFECCLFYKKDFDFQYKYGGDYTLKEAIVDGITYKKENNSDASKEENLLNFIDKVIIKQKFDSKTVESSFKEIKTKI